MFFHLEKEGNPIICNTVMNLEDVIRGEISQTGKNKYHMIPLICGISNSLTHRSSVQRVVTGCSVRSSRPSHLCISSPNPDCSHSGWRVPPSPACSLP